MYTIFSWLGQNLTFNIYFLSLLASYGMLVVNTLKTNEYQLIVVIWSMASWNLVNIGSGNGVASVWHQAITCANDDLLSSGP